MSRVAYYIIFILSLIPLRILYLFSDFFYFLLCYIIKYRKDIIEKNLVNSFPDLSQKEINNTRKQIYKHLSDILFEGIKNLSISKEELKKRVSVLNPEVLDEIFNEKKSVILVSGHYNNWEWMISAQAFLFPHKAMGIGMPLSNSFWDKKINERRARFGMNIAHAKNYKEKINAYNNAPHAILTLSDQSPGNSLKSYWTSFLNQQTGVLFGIEMMAHEYQYDVVFFKTRKKSRGYYEITLIKMEKNPNTLQWGGITEWHTKKLEELIHENPAYWLWTHKRWKREVPKDLEKLKREQKNKFEEKFPPLKSQD